MKSPSTFALRRAFTLLELLVVIAIIGILMSLLITAVFSAMEQAKRVQAQSAIQATLLGVRTFHNDYGRMPSLGTSPGDDLAVTSESMQIRLYNILRNREVKGGVPADQVENTHGTLYLSDMKVVDSPKPRAAFGTNGAFYDPWGGLYSFVIDTSYDNFVDVRDLGLSPSGEPEISSQVIGLSPGRTEEPKDDVKSW